MIFCACLLSFSITFPRFVIACISNSFLFIAKEYSIVWIYILLINLSADGPWGCFFIWAVNTIWLLHIMLPRTFTYKFLCGHKFSFYISRSGNARSYDNSTYNLSRNYQAALQSGYTILRSHQKNSRVPLSPHPQQHLLSQIS